ncbi:YciI family protein [Bacillus fonticola]|uniref:YciI family protein n=1 Tax=Bacillus fonticola TaxID=2728853 RepID=UPI0014755623|nr:YciI family protein [Bacillus fonticola]
MPVVVLYEQEQPSRLTDSLLHNHVEYLRTLARHGWLQTCGPFSSTDGAFLLLTVDNDDVARQLVEDDPFLMTGYYRSYQILPYREATEILHPAK